MNDRIFFFKLLIVYRALLRSIRSNLNLIYDLETYFVKCRYWIYFSIFII